MLAVYGVIPSRVRFSDLPHKHNCAIISRMIGNNIIRNRPLAFLSIAGGLRDIIIGLAFILAWEDIRGTRLFKNYDELMPGYSGWVVGVLLLVAGIVVVVTSLTAQVPPARIGLDMQSGIWAFSTLMYALNGDFLFALILGAFFCVLASYTSYYYKYGNLYGTLDRRS